MYEQSILIGLTIKLEVFDGIDHSPSICKDPSKMAYTIRISLCLLLIFGSILICRSEDEEEKKIFSSENVSKALKLIRATAELSGGVFAKGGEIWSAFEKAHDILAPSAELEIRDTDSKINALSNKVDELASDMNHFKQDLFKKLDVQADTEDLKKQLREIFKPFLDLNNFYRRFNEFVGNKTEIVFSKVKAFAISVTESTTGADGLLQNIHELIKDTEINRKNLFEFLADEKLKTTMMCTTHRSAQQSVYNLYQKILIHEIYGYMMTIYAHLVLDEFDALEFGRRPVNPELINAEQTAVNNFYTRMNATLRMAKAVMSVASRDVWRCDPYYHQEGETYDAFGPVFQRYILNEEDIKDGGDYCDTYNCEGIKNSAEHFCHGETCSKQNRCLYGRIRDCGYVSDSLTACPVTELGGRRYQYIKTGEGKLLGPSGTCDAKEFTVTRWQGAISRCDFCICTCESSARLTKRYINLQSVLANVSDNYVVTGVRFINVSDVFHLQIQQGQLFPGGRINASSVHWKPTNNYTVFDNEVRNREDFVTIDWDQRTIFLSDKIEFGLPSALVTGMKFSIENDVITLNAQFSNFDFGAGTLEANSEFWKNSNTSNTKDSTKKGKKINLDNLDLPINYRNQQPSSKPNDHLVLTTSSLDKDAGQNVVPFLDFQSVLTNPPVPLSGIGLHHRSERHSAGFLALKVFTYDVAKHIKIEKVDTPDVKSYN